MSSAGATLARTMEADPPAAPTRYDHVFVVHTHSDAPQVARLVRILRATCPDAFILVSHDRASPSAPVDLAEVPDSALLLGPGAREGMPIVEAYLAALRWLRDRGIAFGWISNLSGQCYPCGSMRDFLAVCRNTRANAFLHHFEAFDIDPNEMAPYTWSADEGRQRYHYTYRKLAETAPWPVRAALRPLRLALDRARAPVRLNLSYGVLVGRYLEDTPFTPAFRCVAGSHWHTIDARAAHALLAFADARPEIVDVFRGLLQSEEAFVQTVLANDPALTLVNDNLRLIDMRRARHGRPRIFVESDIPEIAASGKFFLRKIDARAGRLLDLLDARAAS